MDLWYSALKNIARLYARLFVDEIDVRGLDHVPAGPKIYAANHPNTINAMLLPLIFPERQFFLVSAAAFDSPLWGWFLKGSRQIPVAPGKGRRALELAAEKIAQGNSVVILPEGRTTPIDSDRKGGTGAVRLSLESHAPIVPVGFYIPGEWIKTLRISKRKTGKGYFQFGGPCRIHIGTPWFPPGDAREMVSGGAIRGLTDQLMKRIRALAAQAAEWRPA